MAARKIVSADPSLRYKSLLLGRKATNQQTCHDCCKPGLCSLYSRWQWAVVNDSTTTHPPVHETTNGEERKRGKEEEEEEKGVGRI